MIHENAVLRIILTLFFVIFFTSARSDDHKSSLNLILIKNVKIWNGNSDELTKNQDILIENNLIKKISRPIVNPDGARVINGNGLILIPGIIEAHTHIAVPISKSKINETDQAYITALSLKIAKDILMRGWTTIRDMGGPSQGIAKAIDDGHAIGPRIYPSAKFISQTSGHGDFRDYNEDHPSMGAISNYYQKQSSIIADGPAEVLRAVRESLRLGASQIKVMAGGGISSDYDPIDSVQYTQEEMRAAVTAAEQWNTYVAVHAYTDDAVRNALEAGVKVIEHGHLINKDTLRLMKRKKAYLSTQTFGNARNFARNTNSETARKARIVLAGVNDLMINAKKIGVPIAFGTDSFGSISAFENAPKEFGYRLDWFTSLEILKQATKTNAKLLELTGPRNPYKDGPLGVIEEGAYADLLILKENPLNDIRVLEDYENNILLIMKNGEIYKNLLK